MKQKLIYMIVIFMQSKMIIIHHLIIECIKT